MTTRIFSHKSSLVSQPGMEGVRDWPETAEPRSSTAHAYIEEPRAPWVRFYHPT